MRSVAFKVLGSGLLLMGLSFSPSAMADHNGSPHSPGAQNLYDVEKVAFNGAAFKAVQDYIFANSRRLVVEINAGDGPLLRGLGELFEVEGPDYKAMTLNLKHLLGQSQTAGDFAYRVAQSYMPNPYSSREMLTRASLARSTPPEAGPDFAPVDRASESAPEVASAIYAGPAEGPYRHTARSTARLR